MKKIAFFVEGETEYIFISWLLKKIASSKGIDVSIVANKLEGGGRKKPIRAATLRLESTIIPNAKYEALIQVAGTDSKKKSHIERTINSLDYAYLYDKIRHDIAKVNELVTKIDTFLT